MKKTVCRLAAYLLALDVIISGSVSVAYGESSLRTVGWQVDGSHWRYYDAEGKPATGWIYTGGNWYYIDKSDNYMKTGWLKDDSGNWYFLNTVSDGFKGKMLTGWQWIDGKAYYLSENSYMLGKMFSGGITPDGYKVNDDGQWIDEIGRIIIDNSKGISSKEAVLNNSKQSTVRLSGASGSGVGGGSYNSNGDSGNVKNKNDFQAERKDKDSDSSKGSDTSHNNTADQTGTGNNGSNPDNTDTASRSNANNDKHNNSTGKTDNDKNKKDNDSEYPIITGYTPFRDLTLDFIDENTDSYLEFLPKSAIYKLSNGKKISLKITGWNFEGVPAEGKTVIAKPLVQLDNSKEYLKDSLKTVDSTLKINFKKKNKEDEDDKPGKPDPDAVLTRYKAFDDITLDYIDRYSDSYKDNMPDKVIYELSDNSKIELKIDSWSFEQTPAPGISTRAKAIILNIPPQYNHLVEAIENMPAYINVKFNIQKPSDDELKLNWDHDGKAKYGSEEYSYKYDEDPVISLENYKGDGSDISLTAYLVPSKTFTPGSGINYDAASKKLIINTDSLTGDGLRDSGFRIDIKVADKIFSCYLLYTTDRAVKFIGNEGWSAERVIYSNVSRKKDTVKEVKFTNIPESEYANIRFTTLSGEPLDLNAASIINEDGKIKIKFVYELLKPYITSGFGGSESVSVAMKLKGLKTVNIRLNYMSKSYITLDKDGGYYAGTDPVLTLRNFTNIDENKLKVFYYITDETTGNATELEKDSGYSFDGTNNTVTIKSYAVLGANSLDEDKNYTIRVVSDDDEAVVKLKYKKDKKITVIKPEKIAPYASALVKVEGIDSSDHINNDSVAVYYNSVKINNTKVQTAGYGTSYFTVLIPYASIKDLLVNNKAELTLKVSGIKGVNFEIEYAAVKENGDKVPLEIVNDRNGNAIKQQDGVPIFFKNTSIYLTSKDKLITEEQWKAMGVHITKKGEPESSAIILSVQESVKDWYSTPISVKGILLDALYKHEAQIGEIKQDDDGKWPVYTLTFYMNGYAKTQIDVVLTAQYQY